MQIGQPRAQLTELLTNDTLHRLERLRLNPSRRLTNRSRGEHLSGKGGRSIEFSDYRDYVPGDDFRFVDWNVFARLNRPYLKLYHQEEEMHVVILVDASSSMVFEAKLERAQQLAAAFGLMGLMGGERVSVYAFNTPEGAPARLRPCSGRANMMKLFRFIERIQGEGSQVVEDGIADCLKFHLGRGVAVLLSDFLTFGDVRRAFNLVFNAGLEPFAIQILSPAELDPDLDGDVKLVDSETQNTLDVTSAGGLLGLYTEYRLAFERELSALCRQRNGRFLSISTEQRVESVLFDTLRRAGWIQ
jgi:uncharacterized protein (DUF58 family)